MAEQRRRSSSKVVAPALPEVGTLTASQLNRRTRIVDAAFELLLSLPYDKIQMRDIADAADVALGTVYRYFSSKERLFSFVVLKFADRLDERLNRRPLQGQTNEQRLVEIFGRSLHSFELVPQFFDAARVVTSSTDPLVLENVAVLSQHTSATFQRALDGVTQAQAETIIQCCQALMDWLLNKWCRGYITMDDVYRDMEQGIAMLVGFSIEH